MELQLGEAFKIWVEEGSEEDKELEWNILWKRSVSSTELMSLVVRSDKVHYSKSPWSRGLSHIPHPIFVHLVIGLGDDSDSGLSDHELPLDGLFEERESALPFPKLVVVKDIEKSLLFLRWGISFLDFIFVISELLNELNLPKFRECLQFFHDLIEGLVEER